MIPEKDDYYDAFAAMDTYGGSFAQALANCARAADRTNWGKLWMAFHEMFTQYHNMAMRALERKKL